jgi:hypothetical protein
MMHPSPTHASTSPPTHAPQTNRLDDWAYQGLTIAAMLLLIASLVSFW